MTKKKRLKKIHKILKRIARAIGARRRTRSMGAE